VFFGGDEKEMKVKKKENESGKKNSGETLKRRKMKSVEKVLFG
jgi:hypothetical protein